MAETRILVAIDDSPASRRAVTYVAKLVGRRRGFRLYVVHVLPPLPTELLEHGGSEDPTKETRLEVNLKSEQQLWISAAKKAAQKGLNKARTSLRRAGISAGAVQALFSEPADGRDAADAILQMAHECKCHTIVVGRQSVSWFHELFSKELAEELLRRGKGFSVWLVQ
jgi:nucleotide-binding universal stress UspA family protein